tara:strand:+ start:830 stop:1855 length:1026 start_codon:yes stop_codon:yes gene_type:complete
MFRSNPYIIAEIGVNHEGSLEKAKELIDLAKEGGAHAAKFQSYKADTIAAIDSPAYWDKSVNPIRNQHELFKKYDTFGKDEYIKLYEHCKKVKIDFASTPFDDYSVDYLENLVPFYKISSSDITNIPFIRRIADKQKPILLSTGASNIKEISHALNEIRNITSNKVCLMHCILSYPTEYVDANLEMILGLKDEFNDVVLGYSDHTVPDNGMLILTLAYLKGASIIEKHFTNDKNLPGNDHFHAMDVSDLKIFCNNIKLINETNGKKNKDVVSSEYSSRKNARRSIVVSKSLMKGDTFNEQNLTYKRPESGISPSYWDKVIGKKASKQLNPDHILQWDDIEL